MQGFSCAFWRCCVQMAKKKAVKEILRLKAGIEADFKLGFIKRRHAMRLIKRYDQKIKELEQSDK